MITIFDFHYLRLNAAHEGVEISMFISLTGSCALVNSDRSCSQIRGLLDMCTHMCKCVYTQRTPHTAHATHSARHTQRTPHTTHATHNARHTQRTPHTTHATHNSRHTQRTPHTTHATHNARHTQRTPHL